VNTRAELGGERASLDTCCKGSRKLNRLKITRKIPLELLAKTEGTGREGDRAQESFRG